MDEEGTPTLQPVPGIDLDSYKDSLLERFANPYVRDQVQRLCLEASDRIPKFVLPVVREQLAHDRPLRQSAAIVASWARYCEGIDEQGQPIEIVDNIADDLRQHAANLPEEPLEFLDNRAVFGDLVDDVQFARSHHHRGSDRIFRCGGPPCGERPHQFLLCRIGVDDGHSSHGFGTFDHIDYGPFAKCREGEVRDRGEGRFVICR